MKSKKFNKKCNSNKEITKIDVAFTKINKNKKLQISKNKKKKMNY